MKVKFLFSLALLGLTLSNCQNKQESITPNIIYILADDMGYGDVKAINPQSKIPTPNLDQLVNEGMYFTDAHSNSAVCTPTRYGTLTGRYCFRSSLKSGVLVGHEPALIEPDRPTVATLLKKAGYQTACVGKWHLGLNWAKKDSTLPLFHGGNLWDIKNTDNVDYMTQVTGGPNALGFDYSFIIPSSLDIAPYVYLENDQATASVSKHIPAYYNNKARGMWYRHGDTAEDFDHTTVLQSLTDKAINYISNTSKDQPFFLYFPLTSPHTPWFPSKEFDGISEAGVYGDFVAMTDDVVGQIMKVLDKMDIADNTLIIFTSDNGSHWLPSDISEFGHLANDEFSGMKSDVWEGGHRVPFIARWPKTLKPATKSDHTICSTDLMATCAELTNQKLPQSAEDSYSYLTELTKKESAVPKRTFTIHHSVNGTFAIRMEDWKLIDAKGSGGWSLPENQCNAKALPQQLFNLKQDPKEMHNVYAQYPDKAVELNTLLQSFKQDNEAKTN